MPVPNEQIKAYFPVIDKLATEVARSSPDRAMVEYDDLFQEGCIFVWQSLQKGINPQGELIRKRMLNWVRYLMRHEALRYEEAVEEFVPQPVLG